MTVTDKNIPSAVATVWFCNLAAAVILLSGSALHRLRLSEIVRRNCRSVYKTT